MTTCRKIRPPQLTAANSVLPTSHQEGNWTTEVGIVTGQRVRASDVEHLLKETGAFASAHPELAAAASGAAEAPAPAAAPVPGVPHTLVLVAEEPGSGRVVGCIEVTTTDAASEAVGAPTTHGYLGMLAVDRAVGSRGVGRALMAAGERVACAAHGVDGVVLFVLSCRADILQWYSRRGYADTGLTHPAKEIIASCDPEGKSALLVDGAVFKILLRKLRA